MMLTENLEYLKNKLQAAGFSEIPDEALKAQLEKRPANFQLYYRARVDSHPVVATLYFIRSEQSELYFFHRFDLSVTLPSSQGILKQAFQHDRERQLTLREAFNLLQGRAVNKDFVTAEGAPYNAWVQLDFTRQDSQGNYLVRYYHERYGFNLEEELGKYRFREWQDAAQRARLLSALRAGDRQEVTSLTGDQEETYLIEANPHFKSLKIYDQQMRRVSYRRLMDRPGEADADEPASAAQARGRDHVHGKKRPAEKKKRGGLPDRQPPRGNGSR